MVYKLYFVTDSLQEVDSSLHPTQLIKFGGIFTMSAKERVFVDNVKNVLREKLDFYSRQDNIWQEREQDLNHISFKEGPYSEQSGVKFV